MKIECSVLNFFSSVEKLHSFIIMSNKSVMVFPLDTKGQSPSVHSQVKYTFNTQSLELEEIGRRSVVLGSVLHI